MTILTLFLINSLFLKTIYKINNPKVNTTFNIIPNNESCFCDKIMLILSIRFQIQIHKNKESNR